MAPLSWRAPAAVAAAALALAACAAPAPHRHADVRLAGSIVEIDLDANTLTILDAGRRHTLAYRGDTVVRHGPEDRLVSDLRHGDRIVIVSSDPGEPPLARRIALAGPTPPQRPGSFHIKK